MYTVIYHKNCMDGLAAALAVRQHLWDSRQMKGAKFVTAQYGDEPPDILGRDVVIVDFSYDRETLERMEWAATSIVVIDHHESAEANLIGLEYCTFDMSKSGAVLAWEYFHPDKALPKLFEYVQDRDLWRWELPFSREVSAALASYPPFLDQMARFLDDTQLAGLIAEGAAIRRAQQQYIDRLLWKDPEVMSIGGHLVPCVNSTYLISEIGEALLAKYPDAPFVAIYFETNDGKRIFSLRSTDNRANVADIATQYGGGGHAPAAGFSIEKPEVIL